MTEIIPPLPRIIEERKVKKAVTVQPLTHKFKLLERKESNVTIIDDPKSPHVPEIKFDNFVSLSLKRSSSQTPKKVQIVSPKPSDSSSTPKLVRLGSKTSDPTPSRQQNKTDSIFAFLQQQNEINEVTLVQKPSNASSKSRKTYSRASSRLNNSAPDSCSSPTSESESQPSAKSEGNSQPETPKFDNPNNQTVSQTNLSPTNSPYYRRLSGLLADRLSRTRSSVGSGMGDSTPTRLPLQTLNKMMRVGVLVSDPFIEIDEELKKRRSKEVSFLKLYVGADSEQTSPLLEGRKGNTPDEIVQIPPRRTTEKKKSIIKNEEREIYTTKQALSKEKRRGKDDAKAIRKEIQKSEFRIKVIYFLKDLTNNL